MWDIFDRGIDMIAEHYKTPNTSIDFLNIKL